MRRVRGQADKEDEMSEIRTIEIWDAGYVWHIPLNVIAEKRADFYADDKDTTREEEIEFVMEDDYEGLDWYLNNMDFEDVAEHAVLVKTPPKKEKPGPGAEVQFGVADLAALTE